jgi:type VI protein secretion system component Hcp
MSSSSSSSHLLDNWIARALVIIDLADLSKEQDLTLMIESKGTVIEGECTREFEDGKKRLDVLGYGFAAAFEGAAQAGSAKVNTSGLTIVRMCDAASASLASLLKNQAMDLKVVLSSFKAGGDDSSKNMQPTLEFEVSKGRLMLYSILTPNRLNLGPCEVISIAYEGLELRSAPQTQTGQRGAVRTCTFSG